MKCGIGYGAFGRPGFNFDEKSSTIIDYDSDYAGGISIVSYTIFKDDLSESVHMHSIQIGATPDQLEEKELYNEILDYYEKYGGFFINGNEVSEEEYKEELRRIPAGTGNNIDCYVQKSESEIFELLVNEVDEYIKNENIGKYISEAYGKNIIDVNGKQESVYDYVVELSRDNKNDLLKVDTENNDILLYFEENGEFKVGHLRDDSKLSGSIKCLYIKNNELFGDAIYVSTEEHDENKKRKTLYELSVDVNTNFYISNYWTKEEELDPVTKKILGVKYYEKGNYSSNYKEKEIEKSAFEWRIDYNTKTKEDTKVRTIYNLEKIF